MYLPYLRGKQFELTALREISEFVPSNLLKPVIEPVRLNFNPLLKTIVSLNEKNIVPAIIINPSVGDFVGDISTIFNQLESQSLEYLPCIKISGSNDTTNLNILQNIKRPFALHITGGIDKKLIPKTNDAELVIVDSQISPLVLNRLRNVVLIGDFFEKKSRNSDYDKESIFSHLHVTYNDLNSDNKCDTANQV